MGESFDDMVRTGRVEDAPGPKHARSRSCEKDPGAGSLMHVVIYTDGAARGNPGRGGYGAVLLYTDPSGEVHRKELSQGYRCTTNNRMELMGVIVALEALKQPCEVELHSDSQYVVNAFNKGWVWNWAKNGWKTASKKPVKNPDLWKRLLGARRKHEVTFIWVKGHATSELNNRCDELATSAADGPEGSLIQDEGFFREP